MTHLTISQCQKLKEIGFPQEDVHFFYSQYGSLEFVEQAGWEGSIAAFYPQSDVACPTLESLIEWLGEDFWHLNMEIIPDSEEDAWSAEGENYQCYGVTPLEATYNLAVAIKSKQPEQ